MPTESSRPEAPSHLTTDSKKFWDTIVTGYALELHHLRILQAALEAWDDMVVARTLVAKEGPVYYDKFSHPHHHPAVAQKQRAREQFSRLMRQLDLEGEPDALYRR